ncbi:MAG: hypothetical protein ABI835_05020 [Chloroflexota bacterium]
MRRLMLILALLVVGVIALSSWQPGAQDVLLPTPTVTMLPDDFTLISTFVPSFPCELQQVEVYDDKICRYESVKEQVLAEGDGVTFIQYDYHMGQGCWDSVSQDIHELHVCQRNTGAVTLLTDELTSGLLLSLDGAWYAYGTMDKDMRTGNPHVFRVRRDGTDVQQLDTQGFPASAIGAPGNLRWLDDQWLAMTLWDGSGADGYHPFRLKTDGSGVYEALPDAEATEMP